ncbi:DNA polymerase III subunit delta [Halovulum dunhuangense]|uniref:DNA-directed DNA polymerase n=1 Tax=Halovulum dunhuangense TaxID=1505036 RepID=A0A849L040_9RHOB|nr:DNA polymerase III subunit delta [Halovulum dunhuangense]NNU79080.1 DNA polymerase III subunit delta [Halovulum dunhuangense]
MKLPPRDLLAFIRKPDASRAGILIFGQDPMRIALRRQDLAANLGGPQAESDMRLTRLSPSDLRGEPSRLSDALKEQGFFPGQRVVTLEDATDALAKPVTAALEDWRPGDAFLIVTAGNLTPRSALRKLFENAPNAYAAAVYADPPGRDEIEATLNAAGLKGVSGDAMRDLTALAQALDPGDFRQTVERLALYKHGDPEPLSPADIAAIAPAVTEAAVDDVIAAAADGELPLLCATLPRLAAQGVNPTTLCIALQRHFRQLHAAASHPAGAEQALARARPPVFGPRRDRMLRQARHWGPAKLEQILHEIMDTDLSLRSSRPVPGQALVERLMMRIAMIHSR